MYTVPAPDRERADARRNRARILCAAARLMHERGVDCVSMDDVAAAAQVGKGTLYRRFGDRASLVRALIDEPERDFQEAIIRGTPPLGPGASPRERLFAFGAGALRGLEQNAHLLRAAEGLGAARFVHPVHAFYQTHLDLLLRDGARPDAPIQYLVDCLLAPLGAEPFLYQREVRGMSLEEMIAGWCALADGVLAISRG
jgi:AcrR family transcriptional regulator